MEIQAPHIPVGQDAKPDFVVGLDIDAAQILEHLRRGHAFFARITLIGAIERAIPAFGFQNGQTMLKAFPLLCFADGKRLGCRISEQQRVGNLLAPFLRENLLDLVVRPVKRLNHRVDELFLGFGFIGLCDLLKARGQRLQALLKDEEFLVLKILPLFGPLDAVQQIIACEQVARNHEFTPAECLTCSRG